MILKLFVIVTFQFLTVAGYNISDLCGGCENGGSCNLTVLECICPTQYSGFLCEDYSWNDPTDTQLQRRSTIVSLVFAAVVMASVCFLVICVNVKRIQERREDALRQQEMRNAVQVDGPPMLRVPSNIQRQIKKKNKNIQRESTGCFDIALPRIPTRTSSWRGLRGITTSPAVLQGSKPPSYRYVVAEDKSKSGVTIQGDSLVSLPPEYDAAIVQNNSQTSNLTAENDSSGIFMNIDSVETQNERGVQPTLGRSLSHETDNSSVILIHTIDEIDEIEEDDNDDGVGFMDDSSQSSHASEGNQCETQTTRL
uniref:Uncharacterized protein LOC102805854 n=1 Tax=Saccoglossus kowalevskii TaxID=10224 RepID=A0ABM0MJV2_SACKO|nr:PREDICTED: uncharacterized protein LOC102805854 [Saccoglossus kowalevskii]